MKQPWNIHNVVYASWNSDRCRSKFNIVRYQQSINYCYSSSLSHSFGISEIFEGENSSTEFESQKRRRKNNNRKKSRHDKTRLLQMNSNVMMWINSKGSNVIRGCHGNFIMKIGFYSYTNSVARYSFRRSTFSWNEQSALKTYWKWLFLL